MRGAVDQSETPVNPVDPDSFEGLWGATAQSSAFLDLRNASTGGEWLDELIVSSLLNAQAYPAYLRKHIDAAVFLRTMRRATKAE